MSYTNKVGMIVAHLMGGCVELEPRRSGNFKADFLFVESSFVKLCKVVDFFFAESSFVKLWFFFYRINIL